MAIQPQARERTDLVHARGLAPGEYVLANFDTDQLEQFLTEHQIKP